MNDLEYIISNFIEQKELCEITNITLEELNQLIERELIPDCSYKIETKHTITSPLNDKHEITESKKYFPKSAIDLINKNIHRNSEEFKAEMKKEFIKAVLENDRTYLIHKNTEELDHLFETKWQYFIQGVYGICTLNSTPLQIAKKGITVQKLINFLEKKGTQNELIELNNDYNEVSNIFAPYQRTNSSRGKYLDSQLQKNDLEKLIKRYDK